MQTHTHGGEDRRRKRVYKKENKVYERHLHFIKPERQRSRSQEDKMREQKETKKTREEETDRKSQRIDRHTSIQPIQQRHLHTSSKIAQSGNHRRSGQPHRKTRETHTDTDEETERGGTYKHTPTFGRYIRII